MTDTDSAQEQLRIIRALMERATIYRAISAPIALIGGLLSLGGFGLTYLWVISLQHDLTWGECILLWLAILGLTLLSNLVYMARNARQRNEPLFSPGMKWALKSVAPAVLLVGMVTVLMAEPTVLALLWITLYGLALLSTQHFAPKSLVILGWSFFLTGCGLFLGLVFFNPPIPSLPSVVIASGLMAATFGGYHLLYALLLGMQARRRTDHV